MKDPETQLVRGTVHMLILRTLAEEGSLHGYGIVASIEERTGGALGIEDGALYQALHRMQERGWLESEWGHAETGKRARFYRLTRKGRARLATEEASWSRYVEAVTRVLRPGRP